MFLVLFASMLSIKAEEMYVVKSSDGSTLTFYYDDLKSSREGTVFGINEWRDLRIQNFEGGNSSLADGITGLMNGVICEFKILKVVILHWLMASHQPFSMCPSKMLVRQIPVIGFMI